MKRNTYYKLSWIFLLITCFLLIKDQGMMTKDFGFGLFYFILSLISMKFEKKLGE